MAGALVMDLDMIGSILASASVHGGVVATDMAAGGAHLFTDRLMHGEEAVTTITGTMASTAGLPTGTAQGLTSIIITISIMAAETCMRLITAVL